MKRIALLIAITTASLRAAPADKTLNLSVYSTSSGKFLNQAFTVSGNNGKVLGITGGAWALVTPSGGSGTGDALTTDPLSQFAATTSAQLRGVISDESGTGALLFAGGNIGAATATSLNGLTISTTTGTLTLANGKTLTSSNTLTLAGTDGSTLNIGAGGTLGAAALLGTSAGGNGTADNGKAVIFGTGGIIDATTEITVHNSANAAYAYLSDDGTLGFHAVGETNPRELVFPTDVLENEAKEIATKDWVGAQGYGSGGSLTSTYVGYGSGANALTGEAALNYTAASDTLGVGNINLAGVNITAANAIGALAIDVTKSVNTKSISADSAFTFSATPTAGTWFSLILTEGGAAARTVTIPSSYSMARGGLITTFPLAASSVVKLDWYYDGTVYRLWGDQTNIGQLSADTTPALTDVVEKWDGTTHEKSTLAQVAQEMQKIVIKSSSGTYTLGTDNSREAYGGVVYVTTTNTQTLPAIAAGMSVTFIADAAVVVTIDPSGSEVIRLNGTDLSAGFAIKSSGAIGEIVVLTYHGAGKWYASTSEFVTNGS